ncbi:hypothetical protein SEA_MARKY_52 [Streptomyces phage Marky]|nr:hypothetical protein SEA_MARKY_52 [Streptomyces phage Marky]
MKISKLTTGNRVGRDRRPYARKVYAWWAAFWALMVGLYAFGGPSAVAGLGTGGTVLHWFFFGISVAYLAANLRIWHQHAGRVLEWETAHPSRARMYGHKEI